MWTGLNRAERRVRGMTLVELLIAVVLTSLVVAGAVKLSNSGTRLQFEQESVEMLQNEAQLAMYHLAGRLQSAYYMRWGSPSDLRIQRVRPDALGEPPDPAALDLATSYRHERYSLDATTGQLLFEEQIHPVTLAPLPGYRRSVLASYITDLTMAQPAGAPNICEITVTVRHPQSGETHTLGPMRVASREMSAVPPVGWEPPLP